MKSLKVTLAFLFIRFAAIAQTEALDAYIAEGLQNNEAVRQQNFNLEKSIYALREATGLYMPSVNLKADYVDSRGGRTIDFPIGDIINPIHDNLNRINPPGFPLYPSLNNVSVQLNPQNFYNAYVRASVPIVNAEIWYNRRIKKDQINLQRSEVLIYKRELVKEIKVAYFNYLKATSAVSIYENALTIVNESERVNQKLVDNGKEVIFALSRAKSEVSKIKARLNDAKNTQKNAAAYLNFLLNKPLDSEVKTDEALLQNVIILPADAAPNSSKREELTKLFTAKLITNNALNLSRSSWIPKLGAQVDLGSQASDFVVNRSTGYYLLGISFDWSIFNGLRDVQKVKQAKLDVEALESQTKYVEMQLKLSATTAANSYTSSVEQYRNAITEETTSGQYFNLMNKRYKEGQALYIEYLDARNENTLSSLRRAITYFDAWIRLSESERANADYKLPQ